MGSALKAPSLITSREEGIRSLGRVELRVKEQWNGRTRTGKGIILVMEREDLRRGFKGGVVEGKGDSEGGGDMVDLTDSMCSWGSKSNLQLLFKTPNPPQPSTP